MTDSELPVQDRSSRDSPTEGAEAEMCLFAIWERARQHGDRILQDLVRRFEVLEVNEVHWTPSLATRNFRRFYSDLPVRGVYHVLNKGAGPFLVVTLVDRKPRVEARMTSRGERVINTRFLDAKIEYRTWSDEFAVHCTETPWETERDLTALLGFESEGHRGQPGHPWDGRIRPLSRDLTGTGGWPSAEQLFGFLERSVTYVALNASHSSPGEWCGSAGQPILELLTDDYERLYTALDAHPVFSSVPRGGGRFHVRVGTATVLLAIRFVGDGYYDKAWAQQMLEQRVRSEHGVFRPAPTDERAALAYHALVHHRTPRHEHWRGLATLAESSGADWAADAAHDPARLKQILDRWMHEKGLRYSRPRDLSVLFNHRVTSPGDGTEHPAVALVRRWGYLGTRALTGPLVAAYASARDQLLLRAPYLRRLKRLWRRR